MTPTLLRAVPSPSLSLSLSRSFSRSLSLSHPLYYAVSLPFSPSLPLSSLPTGRVEREWNRIGQDNRSNDPISLQIAYRRVLGIRIAYRRVLGMRIAYRRGS